MATVDYVSKVFTSGFLGTPGLPGVSTNLNPSSISSVTQGLVGGQTVDLKLPGSDNIQQNLSDILNESSGLFTPGNLLSNASNAIFGTKLSTASVDGLPNTSSGTSLYTEIFLRGVIIILGFIFVAVGLSMFKSGEITIGDPLKGVKKSLKG